MNTVIENQSIKIRVAYEVLIKDETGKSKAQIARDFNISPRSVDRYFETYHEDVMNLMLEGDAEKIEAAQVMDLGKYKVEFKGRVESKPESKRGRKRTRSEDVRMTSFELDRFEEEDREFIMHILTKVVIIEGNKNRAWRPTPDAVLAYRTAKGNKEAFVARMIELGYNERKAGLQFNRAANYMINEKF